MPRKARQVETGLLAKGFRRIDSKHRKFRYAPRSSADAEIQTLMSHGRNRDIGDAMLAMMARQVGLTRREFDQLIDCTLSQDQYETLLIERGLI